MDAKISRWKYDEKHAIKYQKYLHNLKVFLPQD